VPAASIDFLIFDICESGKIFQGIRSLVILVERLEAVLKEEFRDNTFRP
jgi:hypothetical protein